MATRLIFRFICLVQVVPGARVSYFYFPLPVDARARRRRRRRFQLSRAGKGAPVSNDIALLVSLARRDAPFLLLALPDALIALS